MATINIDKIDKSDAGQDVKDIYKRVKKHLIDNTARKDWKAIREKNWNAVYPLDPENDEAIWTKDERKQMIEKGQIPIAVNDLAKGVQGSTAVITAKNPGLQFTPIGSNDLYVAELLKRGADYVVNTNNGTLPFYQMLKEVKISGLGILEARHDPAKGIFGKILIEKCDPDIYYFDPESKKPDHSDVSFGKAQQITKEEAKEKYDDLTDEDLAFDFIQPDEDDEGSMVDTKIGKDNYAEEGKSDTPSDDEKEEFVWEIEDWELKKTKQIWVMIPNEQEQYGFIRKIYQTYGEIEKAGWTLSDDKKVATDSIGEQAYVWRRMVEQRIQRIIVGKKVVSKLINPLDVDCDGDPVLTLSVLQHDETLRGYPTCPVTRAMELTRSRNKRRMQSIYVVSKNVDAPIVTGSGYKWIKDSVHGDILQVDKSAPFQPTRLIPGTSSMELLNMEQIDKQDINDEFDINDVLRGKIPQGQSNMAGRTVLALQDMVGVMNNPFASAFENCITRLGRAIVALMVKTWPRQMWQRLIEPDEMQTWQPDKEVQIDPQTGQKITPKPDMVTQRWMQALEMIRPSDPSKDTGLKLIDIDVKIIAGSTQPTNRMAKQAVAMDMVKAGIYDAEAALEYVDDPLKDKVVDRMKQKAQNAGAEKISVSVAFKDLPPEAQAQLAQQIGIQMNPDDAIMGGMK